MRILKRGSKGEAVRRLQRQLNTKLRIHLHVDGDFRKETEKAVKRFQGTHSLTIDGVVGPETWEALQAPVKPPVPPDVPPVVEPPYKHPPWYKGPLWWFAALVLIVLALAF